ncbi:MAG: spore germination protein [Oscillospiraceae bacterium]
MNLSFDNYENEGLVGSVSQDLLNLRTILGNTMDLNIMTINISGVDCAVVTIEAMVSTSAMSELIFHPLMRLDSDKEKTPEDIIDFICKKSLLANERITAYTYGDAVRLLFSGFALILVDTAAYCIAFGIQGYDKKSISSPTMENNVMGSQEAFTEVIRTNISLIRRRIKHAALRFEMLQVGELSNTDVCIVYIKGKTDDKMVREVRKRLSEIELDTVLGTGFVRPFLEKDSERMLFSEVGYTERPDMLCANIIKGNIGVLIDGTPFCIICPYVFTQNFNSFDDYSSKTYYASFLKLIRYIAFILAAAFPGVYLAAVNFNPEMLNLRLLSNLSLSEKTTMLPLFTELVIMMLLLEVMREASIRLPKAVGAAMSIAGGLIIGDAAVKSGLISSPLLIVIGVTATASFVLPSLNQQVSVLRLMFIFAGGFAGFFGISVCAVMALANICSESQLGIPFTSPITPFKKKQAAEAFGRKTYKAMEKQNTTLNDMT